MQHLQDHCRQVGAQDLRISKCRSRVEILFAVQAHTDARLNPATAALTLICTGLGDRLNWQALDLGPVAVTADPRGTAVDHVANPRHRQRGFCNVGRQHHTTARMGLENLLLLSR
ncbi:hypothetical protein D3C78_1526780 [compost metagenome]